MCCSSGASGNPSPCHRPSADVAVHLTLVATIEQLVRWRGFWDAGELLWKAQRQGFAERQP